MCTGPVQADAEPDTIDRLLSVLSKESRRLVLKYFESKTDETASIAEVAEYIVDHQAESPIRSKEQVQLRLHHVDLPKLAEAGIIDYDTRQRTVRYRGHSKLGKAEGE